MESLLILLTILMQRLMLSLVQYSMLKVLKKASFLLRDKALNTADVLERLKSDFLPEEPKVSLLIDSIERSSRGITR